MIHLNPFRQSPGYCGPASLKILLEHFGKIYSEDELATLCGSTREKGTDHAQLVNALQKIDEHPIEISNASFDDIRSYIARGVPVIVGWWSISEDHYSVVVDITQETISLMDPEEDELVVMTLKAFESVWYDFDSAQNIRVDRWMLGV